MLCCTCLSWPASPIEPLERITTPKRAQRSSKSPFHTYLRTNKSPNIAALLEYPPIPPPNASNQPIGFNYNIHWCACVSAGVRQHDWLQCNRKCFLTQWYKNLIFGTMAQRIESWHRHWVQLIFYVRCSSFLCAFLFLLLSSFIANLSFSFSSRERGGRCRMREWK